MHLLLECDGGSRGNPGPAAYGYVVYDLEPASGAGIILEKCGNYIGTATNNVAEYQGVIAGLNWVHARYPQAKLEIKMDSLLIVNQLKGEYKVKNAQLLPLYHQAKKLMTQLKNVSISHTYRSGNTMADSLVNEALDLALQS